MTHRITRPKWIIYRHTRDFKLICIVAKYLKEYTTSSISAADKTKLILKMKELGYYSERNPKIPLDSINHRINTLAYYMFGYKEKINGKDRFLFSPLGNLFMKYMDEPGKLSKIFLTMLWGLQFEHPHGGTNERFKLYPFRLIFKLLLDDRLGNILYAFEVEYLVVFIERISKTKYEKLIGDILKLRELNNAELRGRFNQDGHTLVNAAYEWDYYFCELCVGAKIFKKFDGEVITKIQQGNTSTYRKITRNGVRLNDKLIPFAQKLLTEFPYDSDPLDLEDRTRLKIDITKEIYSFFPEMLLEEIGAVDYRRHKETLEIPTLIVKYSNNSGGKETKLFEEILEKAFNLFVNVQARRIAGPGNTDIECLFINGQLQNKFSVDAKSTQNKLSHLSAGRLESHRLKIGGDYTIIITPRYVPAVITDIKVSNIVIILASTFSEYLYNCINADFRNIDYTEIHNIIITRYGSDISSDVSALTFNKFAVSSMANEDKE